MRKLSGIRGLRQFFARGLPVAALCSLAFAPSALAAVSLEKVELIHQHRTCTVTTKEPIYNERRSVTCGVESETRYTESSCPVERFRNCADPSHGVAYWEDATASPGSYTTGHFPKPTVRRRRWA